MTRLDLSPDELLSTTRAVRKRLDLERLVEREVIEECMELALQAPTGSNRQGWQFVFVTDPAKKKALAEMYAAGFDPYVNAPGARYEEGDIRAERSEFVRGSAMYLRDHFHEVPVMLIPCIEGRMGPGMDSFAQASVWGSILPAVWSFMLAARSRGLGTAWTTLHLPKEKEAAELLGIPYDRYTQAGLMPVAYTKGTDFKPAPRLPLDTVVHWETW